MLKQNERRYSRKDIEALARTDPTVAFVMTRLHGVDWTYQEALICLVCMLVKQKDAILADALKLTQTLKPYQETIDGRD